MNKPLKFRKATEPTNIIWENRQFNVKDRVIRSLAAITIVSLLLSISFYGIFITKKKAVSLVSKYKMDNCADLVSYYGEDLEKFAFHEWISYYQKGARQLSGVMNCFCKHEMATTGLFGLLGANFTDGKRQGEICNEWVWDRVWSKTANISISFCIVLFNTILRVILA